MFVYFRKSYDIRLGWKYYDFNSQTGYSAFNNCCVAAVVKERHIAYMPRSLYSIILMLLAPLGFILYLALDLGGVSDSIVFQRHIFFQESASPLGITPPGKVSVLSKNAYTFLWDL